MYFTSTSNFSFWFILVSKNATLGSHKFANSGAFNGCIHRCLHHIWTDTGYRFTLYINYQRKLSFDIICTVYSPVFWAAFRITSGLWTEFIIRWLICGRFELNTNENTWASPPWENSFKQKTPAILGFQTINKPLQNVSVNQNSRLLKARALGVTPGASSVFVAWRNWTVGFFAPWFFQTVKLLTNKNKRGIGA